MNSSSPRRRFARIAVASVALTGLLAACGGSDSGDDGSSGATGPVTLPFWGWANGQEALVKSFNAAHKDVQLKYTKVTDQLTMQKQLSNAVKAGNAPCLVQNTAEYVTTWVSQGALADITEYVGSSADKFNAGAWAGVQVQGKVYGVPTSSAPAFTIYRTDVFKKYGLKAPATWDDFIAAGKVLKKHGIHITNYAGEDPSTLEVLAMQAGAHWYAIDGDSWKVNFQDDIAPIFEAECGACHNGSQKKGGLALDSYSGAMEGGATGGILSSSISCGTRTWLITLRAPAARLMRLMARLCSDSSRATPIT